MFLTAVMTILVHNELYELYDDETSMNVFKMSCGHTYIHLEDVFKMSWKARKYCDSEKRF